MVETKRIDLPNGWSATIKARDWISERESRYISSAIMSSVAVGSKLNEEGFDNNDPKTYTAFVGLNEQEREDLNAFQTVILCQFVTTLNTGVDILNGPFSADALEDIPQVVFDALSTACLEEWSPGIGELIDPKAPTDA